MDALKTRIYAYIEQQTKYGSAEWVMGGDLERLAMTLGHKASNGSRRARELEQSGVIIKSEIQINGKGPKVVRYRCK